MLQVTRPLSRRTATHVFQAVKAIVIQLKQTGLYASGLHNDRAREFKARAFKECTMAAGLLYTMTGDGDPSGNSTAELGAKWIKARIGSFLKASGFSFFMGQSKTFADNPSFHPPATSLRD